VPTFASFDGASLAYADEGDGDAVVLLHGFAADSNINWVRSGVFDALVEDGHRVVALDARGHGLSDKPHDPEAYRNDAADRDVRALLDHLAIDRCTLVGYSMGSRTALRVAAIEPRVDRVAAVGIGERSVSDRGPGPEAMVDALLAEHRASITDKVARRFRALADSVHADRFALAASLQGSARRGATISGAIEVPVLVVGGADDDLAGPPGPVAARLAHAEIVVVPGDHFGMLSRPELRDALTKFLVRR
jgi:pimeloyl-ACP methyl ester carboxylesterase